MQQRLDAGPKPFGTLLTAVTTGLPLVTCVGRGTGVDDEGITREQRVRERSLERTGRTARHHARWNATGRRIEMYLEADAPQQVAIPGTRLHVRFDGFETLWTESSRKYREDEIAAMGRLTGWQAAAHWTDRDWPFTETLLWAAC